ncbi:MAG: aldo/keto reductase [Akkermansia sp.]
MNKLLFSLLMLGCGVAAAAYEDTTTAGVPRVQLNNGMMMPRLGLGTFLQPSDEVCEQSVLTALRAGYRHIDTAHAYLNERPIGRAIKASGVPRGEIWLTSKIWPTEYGEGKTLEAIDKMLARLQVDYIDLLYVHQPVGDYKGAWSDMERAVAQGKVRALGISNFDASDEVFADIMAHARVKPVAIQIECHPYAQRPDIREKVRPWGMQVECWFPLGGAMSKGALLRDPLLAELGRKHGKSPAQIILRWHIQEGFSVIPGASDPAYIREDIDIFDFELSAEDMERIRALNRNERFFNMSLEEKRAKYLNITLPD